ncbi:MAG: glycosyltransferase [Desulfonauticus sp.]|nr:glycosyltransferase [Desulfonauticus sp.]
MKYLLISFLVSTFSCFFIIRFFSLSKFCDTCEGVQKFHKGQVPRIGGCAIYLALWVVAIFLWFYNKPFYSDFLLVLLTAQPVFWAGLLEDITKKVSPFWRLMAGFFSGFLAYVLIGAKIHFVNVPGIDYLLTIPIVSLIFTSFAIAGVSHAFNIIDGFNGLASGVSILVFGAYAYVCFVVQDQFLLYLSLSMLVAIIGFFIWNYPNGYIFLGDSGAYLLGYVAALLGVLLTARHNQVSPWFPLLLVIYPVWETLFSIYRRKFLKGTSPGLPDNKHFHTLIFRRVVKLFFKDNRNINQKNGLTSPFLWFMEFICVIPALLFWNHTILLIIFVLLFIVFYVWMYFNIVKFKTPKIVRLLVLRMGHRR